MLFLFSLALIMLVDIICGLNVLVFILISYALLVFIHANLDFFPYFLSLVVSLGNLVLLHLVDV